MNENINEKCDREYRIRSEKWCGHRIRFVEIEDGEWWAVLKDVCDALKLRSKDVSQRLDTDMMLRVPVKVSEDGLNDLRSRGENKIRWMIVCNESGVYEALFASRRLEARQFRRWTGKTLSKLRKHVGLEGYEVMKMTSKSVQADIDHFLDDIFYDETTGLLMQSVTVQGGDVEQVPFEDQQLFD